MTTLMRYVRWTLSSMVALVAAGALWAWISPPPMVRVAASYAAKLVCSNVFLAGRDAQDVLWRDVQEYGHPLMKFMRVSVDTANRTVSANLLGFVGHGLAVARTGTGCAPVPDGDLASAAAHTAAVAAPATAAAPESLWPEGDGVSASISPAVQVLLQDTRLTGPGMRAAVVIKNGRVVAETYGAGFNAQTPLLGWSMTKTVTAGLIGTLVRDGKLRLDQGQLFPAWQADDRKKITLANLMAMSSGLHFNEDYGLVSDVTQMLLLEPDMPRFAGSQPLDHPPGSFFSYSSGTTVLLSRIWQNAVGGQQASLDYPQRALFGPLGMRSAVIEADARGNFVGSSYMYATARDWARYAQLLLQDGVWNGQVILPPGYVQMMRAPAGASMTAYGRPQYGQGQVWLAGSPSGTPPGQDPDAGFALPADTYWLSGYDGQSIAVIPSQQLAVIRLGLTPAAFGYKPQGMLAAVIKATDK